IHTPTSNAGVDQTICAGDSVILNSSISAASSLQWITLGTGIFSPNDTAINAIYVPDAIDVTSGSTTLILTATNSCASVSDTMNIVILSRVASNAGGDQVMCEGTNVSLNGTITNGTSGQWISTG